MYYSKEMVLKFLPHRDPFLFVDYVLDITKDGKTIPQEETIDSKNAIGSIVTAFYKTNAEHPIFSGHFPGNPILPGVVQVEIMAQASGFIMTKIIPNPFESEIGMALMSVEKAKFRKPVLPNMELKIECTCVKSRGKIMEHECKLYHNNELMSEATLLAAIQY
ncbi:MAG: beta-hydroxyacyl-ACP dehydratase [Halobacteriovoraceae bacterium]|nr:beta-hydroxyacyl-ACP dehydratase [Halobacteriovoraceae bacterium]